MIPKLVKIYLYRYIRSQQTQERNRRVFEFVFLEIIIRENYNFLVLVRFYNNFYRYILLKNVFYMGRHVPHRLLKKVYFF